MGRAERLNPIELDRRCRDIFARVTPETVIPNTRALVALGFTAYQAFDMLTRILTERGNDKTL